jgi:hypothetical protein
MIKSASPRPALQLVDQLLRREERLFEQSSSSRRTQLRSRFSISPEGCASAYQALHLGDLFQEGIDLVDVEPRH